MGFSQTYPIERAADRSVTAFKFVAKNEVGWGQPRTSAMELKGKWAVSSVQSSGTILSADGGITVVWEFRSREVEITQTDPGDQPARSVIYPITIDRTKQPEQLDASSPLNQRVGFTGIYTIEGDTLTICWNVGVFRPQHFESSPSNGFTITTLKRQADSEEVGLVRINRRRD
jgi:uncharacterized protein (TIGR03067 family)